MLGRSGGCWKLRSRFLSVKMISNSRGSKFRNLGAWIGDFMTNAPKDSNFHIIETTASIATKFCTMIIPPSTLHEWSKYAPSKSKMVDGLHLEKSKKIAICNGLTNFDEIWHGDASRPSWSQQPVKFEYFKNPKWRTAAILKIEKKKLCRCRGTLWRVTNTKNRTWKTTFKDTQGHRYYIGRISLTISGL